MNRIIIAGNGFDLAHGLKTKYEDFINWYWKQCGYNLLHCSEKEMSDGLCSFKVKDRENAFSWAMAFQGWRYQRNNPFVKWNEIDALNAAVNDRDYCDFSIMSPLFQRICKQMSFGWVDIENEYYYMLVECKGKKDELEKLNKDFAVIQKLLVEYLLSVQIADIDNSYFKLISACLFAPFQAKDISVKAKDKWIGFLKRRFGDSNLIDNIELYKPFDAKERVKRVHEFKNAYKDQIEFMGVESIDGDVLPHDMLYPDRIMLLNFNYTNTADFYFPDHPSFILNNIHGKLTKPENVIFGYGDELDSSFKQLQDMNDNECLRHIKSIHYLESDNYRRMLEFVESGPFQVVIMGHSCGLSDRTLLNTLFEHKNCVSIKPYYYINEQGKDNYLDIVQNISRNFTNPQLMRDRVVNKTCCSPLPQKGKE